MEHNWNRRLQLDVSGKSIDLLKGKEFGGDFMDKIVKTMELKIINMERKGFPGVFKLWLPKYITKKVAVTKQP